MFNKPVSQLTEEDIQSLVDNKERESSVLEFKQEISGTDREKKEIAKDISAMANAEGGYFIVGIKEKDSQAEAITGTAKTIGNQPVEAWIESVLITNIRPRIAIAPKVVLLQSNPDKVIIVIRIPQSPKRPHMVISEGRNAYYTRHNYQASFADEHEVRSMFIESKISDDEMKKFLGSRKLIDENAEDFAINYTSKQLPLTLKASERMPENFVGNPFVLFSVCPRYLEERIDIASDDFRAWLSQKDKIELFDLSIDFLDYSKTISADSIKSINGVDFKGDGKRLPYRYVEIFRNGYIENGLATELMWSHEKIGLMFQIAYFTAAFWQFIKFTKDLYEHIGYFDEIVVTVSLVEMENVTLHGFGKKNATEKWSQPYDYMRSFESAPTCKQKNIKIERRVIAAELNDEQIEKLVKEISTRVSNAFGESIAKCFDDNGNFDREQLRGYRNVH